MPEINYLAVLLCGVASIIVGSIWYGPLFGKIWMQSLGMDKMTPEQIAKGKKSMPGIYLQQVIAALVVAVVFAYVLWAFSVAQPGSTGVMAGVQGGFWAWLGFVLPIKYGESLWTGRSFKYTAIDVGYWLVMLVIMGLILTAWV